MTGTPLEDGLSTCARAEVRQRNLRTVGALSALFLLPLVGAYVLYYVIGWSPRAHVNHGELIEPARPLPVVSLPSAETHHPIPNVFTHRWALVYVGTGSCDRKCRFALYLMASANLDLSEDMSRIERVFLLTGGCCGRQLAKRYPGMIVLDASGPSASRLLAKFPTTDRNSSIFVVDPLGNLMMRYDSRHDPMGLVEDLQRLLRLSQIG